MLESVVNRPRRTPTQERSRVTVGAILQAAARVLVAEGAGAASTNRIARIAGVGIGTLYQYFPSREAIFGALASQHAEEMLALLARHAGPLGDAPPEVAVPAFIRAMAAAHAIAPKLHLALTETLLSSGPEALAAIRDPGRALVRAWLERHRGAIRPRDLDAATFLLTTTVEAAIHAQILEEATRLSDPSWLAELEDLLLAYLVGPRMPGGGGPCASS
jgi:AcrR family transcriptional regulator